MWSNLRVRIICRLVGILINFLCAFLLVQVCRLGWIYRYVCRRETSFHFANPVTLTDCSFSSAWSATREPAQVFSLLETFYHAFDMLAQVSITRLFCAWRTSGLARVSLTKSLLDVSPI